MCTYTCVCVCAVCHYLLCMGLTIPVIQRIKGQKNLSPEIPLFKSIHDSEISPYYLCSGVR